MKRIKVHGLRSIEAEIEMAGDKSISHRALLLGALADGPTRIENFLPGEDCLATMNALQALGVEIERTGDTSVYLEGKGSALSECGEPIYCGNSGTTMRLLSGILCGQPFHSLLVGDASLHRRPMDRVATPLTQMGARITCQGEHSRPPLEIQGVSPLHPIDYTTPVASAQIKSSVLLAGLQADGRTSVTEPHQSRDHTERMLRMFGASIWKEEQTVTVLGRQRLHGCNFLVPGDFSAAAFWIVAASGFHHSKIILPRVGLNPTRTGALNVLTRMGAQVQETVASTEGEPYGTLTIMGGNDLRGTLIEGKEIPNVIDELPVLAVAAALAEGETIIRDAAELRVKESDRLATVAEMLSAFGVELEERPDGLIIQGGCSLKNAVVNSHGDHRIAMAGAVLGLFAPGTTIIEDTACVATSYPLFEAHLHKILAENPTDRSHYKRTVQQLVPHKATDGAKPEKVPSENSNRNSSQPDPLKKTGDAPAENPSTVATKITSAGNPSQAPKKPNPKPRKKKPAA